MKFKKALAKYYRKWYQDCLDSAEYCKKNHQPSKAQEYLDNAAMYKEIIDSNTEAVDFFSQDDKAFLINSALPKQFRGFD